MAIWQNIKDKFSKKESRAVAVRASGGSGVKWPERNYENFAKETYLKNATAFAAIGEVARSAASVQWRLYKHKAGNKREEIFGVPERRIITRPNPADSLQYLLLKTFAYLVMSGNGFLEGVAPETGPNKGQFQELYSLRPDRFMILENPES